MSEQKSGAVRGEVRVLAAAVLWGTVGPAQVLASSRMTPAALGGWRLLAGGLVLAAFTVRPKSVTALATRGVLRPLLICALSTGVYQAVFLSAVARAGAALATVIALGVAPAATGLCARCVSGERIGPAWLAGTVGAGTGCVLLLSPGGAGVDPLGLLLAVIAGTCYGLYTVFAKQLATARPTAHLPTLSAFSLLLGSVPLLPWMFQDAGLVRGGSTVALIAWLAVATTAVAYGLFGSGLSRTRATTVATLSLAEPLAAALLGVLLLHERLSVTAWVGCALILAGMFAACAPESRDRSREQADPDATVGGAPLPAAASTEAR